MHDKLYSDCGMKIFDPNTQGTFAGGSGCACSAVVLTGYLLDQMEKGVYGKILFVATGALMNPISIKQGVPILGVAHAVAIENKMTEENK
jgi:stage V sporulation protein AD